MPNFPPDLRDLVDRELLTPHEGVSFQSACVVTYQGVHSLLLCFPAFIADNTRRKAILREIRPRLSKRYVNLITSGKYRELAGQGTSPSASGATNLRPAALGAPTVANFDGQFIDCNLANWDVQDQGARGTCVAFATTACYEHLWHQRQYAGAGVQAFSEEFLYWIMKNRIDTTHPSTEWTKLEYAKQALQTYGICDYADCWYEWTVAPPDPFGTPPSQEAVADALVHTCQTNNYWDQDPAGPTPGYVADAAARLMTLLRNGRPVAVCIQTFSQPGAVVDNWHGPDNANTGIVTDPIPPLTNWVSSGGHCVCVTGLARSADGMRDFFLFRNSWGAANWGQNPNSNPFGLPIPAPGYGAISASYLDACCYEILQL